jgi:hypothetical protein
LLAYGASRADAYVYYADEGVGGKNGTIGRAENDGRHPDLHFIAAGHPRNLAVDGAHIYWANPQSIGRANLDGTDPDPDFIKTPSAFPADLAINSGHIYWTEGPILSGALQPVQSTDVPIGRANLDGSGVERNFLAVSGLGAIAADDTHLYWRESGFSTTQIDQIVRANLDGGDRAVVVAVSHHSGAHIAVAGTHVYWSDAEHNEISRAGLDGSAAEPQFLTGVDFAYGSLLAVDSSHVYYGARTKLGRAGLDGSDRTPTLLTGTRFVGLAVDGLRGPAGTPLRSASVAASGAVRLPRPWVTCPPARPACTVTVRAKAPLTHRGARTSIGRTTFSVAAGKTVTAHFQLNTTGRRALMHLKRLKTTITITTRHGAQVTTRTARTTVKAPTR